MHLLLFLNDTCMRALVLGQSPVSSSAIVSPVLCFEDVGTEVALACEALQSGEGVHASPFGAISKKFQGSNAMQINGHIRHARKLHSRHLEQRNVTKATDMHV